MSTTADNHPLDRSPEWEQAFLRTLCVDAPVAIHALDVEGRTLHWNPEAEHLFGWKAEEVLGRKLEELAPQQWRKMAPILRRVLDGETIREEETTRLTKDGRTRHVRLSAAPLRGVDGRIFGALGMMTDVSESRAAEHAMRDSEVRFRIAAQTASDFIYDWNMLSGELRWDGQFDERLGYEPGGVPRTIEGWKSVLHPEDRTRVVRELNHAIEAREPFVSEYRVLHRAGTILHWTDRGQVIYGTDGRAERMVGATTDITERKLADQALRELSATLQNAVEGIARVDAEGIIISSNPAFAHFSGWPPEDITGVHWTRLFHSHDQTRLSGAFHEMRLHGKVQVEVRCVRRDGSHFHSDLVMIAALEQGRHFSGHYVFLKDITERKQAASEIRKLAAFPRFNPYAVMELANDGSLTYFNDAAIEITRAIGREHPSQILPPEVSGIVDECLRSRRSRVRLELQQGDRTISWSFFPVMSLRVVHCYASDITERLALENQLRQSQKMESIGQLAAGVAHDFNNILNIIMGYTNLLQVEKSLPVDAVDSLKQILTASQRASSLTRQLLTFSRRQVMQSKPVLLNELARSLVEMFPRSLSMQVSVELLAPDTLSCIRADSGMIEQVIMNLVLNARDAMDAQGVLTLRTSRRVFTEEDAERGHEMRAGDFVCLEVQDTGCGIPPENLARVFEPFFTTKEVGRGTGLGLATVYGIIKQHEGWVSVESEVGKGTRFCIHIPAHVAVQEAPPPPAPEVHVSHGRETILVVEDETPLRELLVKSLSHTGYQIIPAATGVEGWEVWQKRRNDIDLVFTDLVMPGGISGRELGEKIKATGSNVPVIYTSGYSSDMLGEGFPVKEGENFLSKPYGQEKLRAILREALDRRAAS